MSKSKAKAKSKLPAITVPLSDDEIKDLVSRLKIAAMMDGGDEPYVTVPLRTILRLALMEPIPLDKLR